MKSDRYLRIILTVIAVCLVWICVRDVAVGPSGLFAGDKNRTDGIWVDGGELDVKIVGCSSTALYLAEPISVTLDRPSPEKPTNQVLSPSGLPEK